MVLTLSIRVLDMFLLALTAKAWITLWINYSQSVSTIDLLMQKEK